MRTHGGCVMLICVCSCYVVYCLYLMVFELRRLEGMGKWDCESSQHYWIHDWCWFAEINLTICRHVYNRHMQTSQTVRYNYYYFDYICVDSELKVLHYIQDKLRQDEI